MVDKPEDAIAAALAWLASKHLRPGTVQSVMRRKRWWYVVFDEIASATIDGERVRFRTIVVDAKSYDVIPMHIL